MIFNAFQINVVDALILSDSFAITDVSGSMAHPKCCQTFHIPQMSNIFVTKRKVFDHEYAVIKINEWRIIK
jgi:hypothetical protein